MGLGCRWLQVGCVAAIVQAASGLALSAEPQVVAGPASGFAELRRDWFDADAAPQSPSLLELAAAQAAGSDANSPTDEDLYDVALRGNNDRLFGLFGRSDREFWHFVSPQSNPLFFEDPRTLTELRLHFANQWIPNSNPVFQGGTAQYVAAQIRVAITERLSVIATKDGYFWLNPANPGVADTEGFADIGGGLKYNFYRNCETQTLASAGFTYCMPSGAQRVFQGNGNGEWHLFLSGGKEFFGCAHWVSGAGLRIPNDGTAQSKMSYWSNSFDVQLTKRIYALTQVNWFHWYDSGNALAANFEGNDLFNLGSNDVAGNDIVTASYGTRLKFGSYHEAGIAYEIPLTQRKDLLESRLYLDLTLRY